MFVMGLMAKMVQTDRTELKVQWVHKDLLEMMAQMGKMVPMVLMVLMAKTGLKDHKDLLEMMAQMGKMVHKGRKGLLGPKDPQALQALVLAQHVN